MGTNDIKEGGAAYEIEFRIAHQNYTDETKSGNDIGLLKTHSIITFNDKVQSVSLPTSDPTLNSLPAYLFAGWGRVNASKLKTT